MEVHQETEGLFQHKAMVRFVGGLELLGPVGQGLGHTQVMMRAHGRKTLDGRGHPMGPLFGAFREMSSQFVLGPGLVVGHRQFLGPGERCPPVLEGPGGFDEPLPFHRRFPETSLRVEVSAPHRKPLPPLISHAAPSGSATEIIGKLDSLPSSAFTIDFYSNVAVDGSGYGEGETFLGSMSLSNGDSQTFIFALPNAVTPGEYITAIAHEVGTDNSSEFSAAVQVVHCTPPPTFDSAISIVGSDVQLSWSSPDSTDFYVFRSANDPYFTSSESYDETTASVWHDPDANELGDAATNYYYYVRGADGCASAPGQTVGEFDFALTPGTP